MEMQKALKCSDVPRGTKYYIHSDDMYVCWRDNNFVCTLSNSYPRHSDRTIKRRWKNQLQEFVSMDVPLPSAIKQYNTFMGGVDISDQLINYHQILRQTKKCWKTLFYHILETPVTNAAVLNKWLCMQAGRKAPTMSNFRDALVLAIIENYGVDLESSEQACSLMIRHGWG